MSDPIRRDHLARKRLEREQLRVYKAQREAAERPKPPTLPAEQKPATLPAPMPSTLGAGAK